MPTRRDKPATWPDIVRDCRAAARGIKGRSESLAASFLPGNVKKLAAGPESTASSGHWHNPRLPKRAAVVDALGCPSLIGNRHESKSLSRFDDGEDALVVQPARTSANFDGKRGRTVEHKTRCGYYSAWNSSSSPSSKTSIFLSFLVFIYGNSQ